MLTLSLLYPVRVASGEGGEGQSMRVKAFDPWRLRPVELLVACYACRVALSDWLGLGRVSEVVTCLFSEPAMFSKFPKSRDIVLAKWCDCPTFRLIGVVVRLCDF